MTTSATTFSTTGTTTSTYAPNSSSSSNGSDSTNTARRQRGGICIGTIGCCIITSKNNHISQPQQQVSRNIFSSLIRNVASSSSIVIDPCNIRNAIAMHCILIGPVLYAYESEYQYHRGDTPIHIWIIVGASVWFPHIKQKSKPQNKPNSTDTTTTASTASSSSSNFRFVTNQGTQVFCWTEPNRITTGSNTATTTDHDCWVWLSSIQTGLQLSLDYRDITPAVMPVVPPIFPKTTATTTTTTTTGTRHPNTSLAALSTSSIRYCRVCGVLAASNMMMGGSSSILLSSIVDPNFYQQSTTMMAIQQEHYIPLIQYGIEDKYGPRGNDNGPASPSSSSSSGAANTMSNTCINPNYYVCMNCNIAQGVVQYIQYIRTLYIADTMEQSILVQFYTAIMNAVAVASTATETTTTDDDDLHQQQSEAAVNVSLDTNGNGTNINVMSTSDQQPESATKLDDNQNSNIEDINDDVKLNDLSTKDDGGNDVTEAASERNDTAHSDTLAVDTEMNNGSNNDINSAVDMSTRVILNYVNTSKPIIDEWIRQCGTLYNLIYDVFVPGYIDGIELIEALEEIVGADNIIAATHDNNNNNTNSSNNKVSASMLKQQAFRNCAGDMGTAMKLLLEQAIPNNMNSHSKNSSMDSSNRDTFVNNNDDVDVFRCVLEFLLDLCDNSSSTVGDVEKVSAASTTTPVTSNLSSIAFFWPQLCHIHLRMLPATNATSLARIDLMEDFLLTVATKYSIHLALELVWSHTADLEESLHVSLSSSFMEQSTKEASAASYTDMTTASASSTSNVSAPCRRRRFAVIRFLCELESLLFDFDGGWGGGSVTLGKMFMPTPHQVHIMKVAMTYIQQYRMGVLDESDDDTIKNPSRSKSRCLSRSSRWDRLLREYDNSSDGGKSPTEQAHEKLQIAKHADYFSSHLIFSKRVADIAEKLRFLDVSDRANVLEQELNLLNASGVLGGDPLNRLRDHLIRVVRVPSTESHVFRSKERTPILLLVEIIDEKNEISAIPSESETQSTTVKSSDTITIDDAGSNDSVTEQRTTVLENLSTGESTCETKTISSENLDADIPNPPTCTPTLSEGASEGSFRLSPGPKALKRFDVENESSKVSSLATPKDTIQRIVSSAAEEQLREIELPTLDHIPEIPNEELGTNNGSSKIQASRNDSDGVVSPSKTILKARSDIDESTRGSRKISTLSTLKGINDHTAVDSTNTLAPTGDIRRAVLTAIMMRGLQGNTIAAGTTDSVQLSLKDLERKRATELLLRGDDDEDGTGNGDSDIESTRNKLFALGLTPSLDEVELASRPTEEDEVMEAIRLMLIQNQVAQGNLSPADAAKVLQHTSLSPINATNTPLTATHGNESKPVDMSDHPTINAGDVDPRLVGCGPLPPAVLQALTLWKGGMVSHAELLELVKKDIEFVKHSILVDTENLNMLKENSAFWGRFAFGERWAEKKSRIGASSPQRSSSGWDLMGVIVKSNDDLRQEAFIMQLIELCQEAFELAELELWISPYRILATGRTTGVIECVRNAMSFDALKKRPGYGKGGLREHLHRMTEFTADPGGSFKSAQQNFVRSLAAYSLLSYLFQFKDRHNGNLLLDTAGHVIHIDFGFVFGVAPGGSFSLEMSTPFKLTEEMLDVMGGLRSPLFSEFVTLFCCGFLALQAHCETFLTLLEITSRDSTFKCFDGRDTEEIVAKLRERFNPDLTKEETVSFALDLIKQATTSFGTRQYDIYQYLSQGIY